MQTKPNQKKVASLTKQLAEHDAACAAAYATIQNFPPNSFDRRCRIKRYQEMHAARVEIRRALRALSA